MGEGINISSEDLKTLNRQVREDPIYAEYERMFDVFEEGRAKKIDKLIENKRIRKLRKDYIPTDEGLRDIHYGVRRGLWE